MDFPLIYCNGDSYSNENYAPSLVGQAFANHVGQHYNGFVINSSQSGSNNRRIIRTTVHDLIQQRELNPEQEIIALICLSFELRGDLWIDDLPAKTPAESQFVTHKFSDQNEWRENLLAGRSIDSSNYFDLPPKFFKQYSEGRAFFYSPYAERINLLCDLVMLRALLESLNVKFLVFQGPPAEPLESEYLKDFFQKQIAQDPRFFDLETFGFVKWCACNKFTPLDMSDRPDIAHYGADAHQAFAEQVLIPRLKELYPC